MLTQSEADMLISIAKKLLIKGTVVFPSSGDYGKLELSSLDGREEFVVDMNRRGQIRLTKCTYQERYRKDIILLRLDIDGPNHTNPDGTELPCPHLHIYREGFEDKWAVPLPTNFTNISDLVNTLLEFLRYCNVVNMSDIDSVTQGGMFS